MSRSSYRIYASAKSWIEGEAVQQLEHTAGLDGMQRVVGLPDLHPGKGHPIGMAAISRGRFYPFLVGGDIGCGVALWTTQIKATKAKRDVWARRLESLGDPWDGDLTAWFAEHRLETLRWEGAMGTIGGGNHFAELQIIDSVEDEAAFEALGLEASRLVLTVHSGSRGLGEEILRAHTGVFGNRGLDETAPEAKTYLAEHDYAVRWAVANRALIAHRFLDIIGAGETRRVLDLCHNSVVPCTDGGGACWLHRKGAAPGDQGPLVIPGSRGAYSFLAVPTGDQTENAWSLAHGAGRKWNRTAIKSRLKGEVDADALRQTKLGSVVLCSDRDLLFEEAPEAYKKVETVIDDLVEPGLIRVVARLRPLITFKV